MNNSTAKRALIQIIETFLEIKRIVILRTKYRLCIMSPYKTIKYIKKHKCSISRYGDGEFNLMLGFRSAHFQDINFELSKKLILTLQNNNKNLLLCMPRCMNTLVNANDYAKKFWINWGKNNVHIKTISFIRKQSGYNYRFGDSQITRPYIDWKNDKRARKSFKMLKSLWYKKDILIVEGDQTRLGIGNDLFENCSSIKRILVPAKNAFSYYEQIVNTVTANYDNQLVLLAIGPTATVLASDLSNLNIQTLDIGHIDIEYEWFLRKVINRVPIEGKFTNEIAEGRVSSTCKDKKYLNQIIAKVGC